MLDYRGYRITAAGEREIKGTREFHAPRAMVWDAFTKPDLLKRWLLGPDGWVMTVCEIDLRVGGTYRYVWFRERDKMSMGMGGWFREIDAPRRLVSTEKFDQSWYPGEMVGTLELAEQGGKTMMRQTFLYESREARDMVLKSPMDEGMVAGFNRLDEVLAELRNESAQPGAGAPDSI